MAEQNDTFGGWWKIWRRWPSFRRSTDQHLSHGLASVEQRLTVGPQDTIQPLDQSQRVAAEILAARGKAKITSGQVHQTVTALATLFLQAVRSRREYIMQFDQARSFYLVDSILRAVAEDSLTREVTSGQGLTLTSSSPEVSVELRALQEKIDLNQTVNDIILDLLGYGEYALRIVAAPGEGVLQIVDDIDQTSVVGLYHQGYPTHFIKSDPVRGGAVVVPPYTYAHFVLGKHRLRVRLQSEFMDYRNRSATDSPSDLLPVYARVGRPLLYGVLSKIASLQLLENLVPAMKLNDLFTGNVVGVSVPPNTLPEKAQEIVQRYEEVLNTKIGLDQDQGHLTLADIMTVAGQIKILPVFGNRGELSRLDIKDTNTVQDLLRGITDDRAIICSSIGFPPELLFGGEEQGNTLKRYARYVRMVKDVQLSIVRGIRQLALIHLVNKRMSCSPEDINIQFPDSFVSIDALDALEYSDGILAVVKDMHEFVAGLMADDNFRDTIDIQEYKQWLSKIMMTVITKAKVINPQQGNKQKADQVTQTPTAAGLPGALTEPAPAKARVPSILRLRGGSANGAASQGSVELPQNGTVQ